LQEISQLFPIFVVNTGMPTSAIFMGFRFLAMEWEVQGLSSFAGEIEQFKITLLVPIDFIAWLFD